MGKLIDEKRMKHMHAVAEYMYEHADKYNLNRDEMYLLGLLHDIGYLYLRAEHEKCGAAILNNCGYNKFDIVESHGMTPTEYKARYNCSDTEIPKELVLLWEANMSIDAEGNNVGLFNRLGDVCSRYGATSETFRVCNEIIQWLRERI